jgi:hypothetical protein
MSTSTRIKTAIFGMGGAFAEPGSRCIAPSGE